jgi:2,3-bisphosphoglycerate-independent phosphoglycerate mutase
MLFLDGVGIGRNDPDANPFAVADLPVLRSILDGRMIFKKDPYRSTRHASVVPLNATLGVPGLPQSGTGQTALLTGLNAPKLIGKHFGPYPYSTLRPVLEESNIFNLLHKRGRSSLYVNAFPKQYFDYIHSHRSRIATISSAWLSTGMPLNDGAALSSGRALSADITNERWPKLGYPEIHTISPRDAGLRLAGFLRRYDFVLFEYYFTDHAGHHQSMHDALAILKQIDEMLEGIFSVFDEKTMLFLLTSDHGNMEDLTIRTHTRNPVPLIAVGHQHRKMTSNARSLTDIAPLISRLIQ